MNRTLQPRHAIPVEQTWDLTHLFPDQTSYTAALAELETLTASLMQTWHGQVAQADAAELCQAVAAFEQLAIRLGRAGTYASLAVSVDLTDDALNSQAMRFESLAAAISSQLALIISEFMDVPDERLDRAAALDPAHAVFYSDTKRQKKHRLQPETEKVLAALSPTLGLPSTAYEQAKHADMDFGSFEAGGQIYPLSFVLFENDYNLSPDRDVRRSAFDAFSAVLMKYQNTVASLYNGEVQKQKILSRLRGFPSVFDYLLDEQKVSRDLYDRQIDIVMDELAPHMRRYARLLQKAHNLEKMTFADLKVALDPGYDPVMDMAEARQVVSDALGVLGPDYQAGVLRAFDERWIDYAQNIGKMTGGFCASPYQVHGYILLSWTSHLSEVFTLAHELGHALHFVLAQAAQPYLACEPSLYMVEAPSTLNELLLMQALLKQNPDPRFQRWVLASLIQNTYYHNFVTHLLEAAYQREVYRRVDTGEHLQASDLNAIKRDVLTRFWGDAVEINDGAELTWMRQPHYYMGLYSYTYSAGLTIATEVNRRIQTEGETAVQDYLAALKAGASVGPVAFAALAGVDVTGPDALRRTIKAIGAMVDELEKGL